MSAGRCGAIRYNDFHADLQYSLEARDDECLNAFYLQAFPMAERVETVEFEEHPELQRKGIDKIVHFSGGKTVTVDEKKRRRDYGDILLELYSVLEKRKLGWLYTAQCDYIVYAIPTVGKVFLLPTLLLQMAWKKHKREWKDCYAFKDASNPRYTTRNIAIPTDILLAAIGEEMRQRGAKT